MRADVVHHSDQGSQYTFVAFGVSCREAGVRPSSGPVGEADETAIAEAFFATRECVLRDRRSVRSRPGARMAAFAFIEGFCNPTRRHSALGSLSPSEYEARAMADNN